MTANLDNFITASCLNPVETDCPLPGEVANTVIVKPETSLVCATPNQSLKFKAYLVSNDGVETELTQDVTWSTNDLSILQIGVKSGNAYAVSPGIATVAATWDGITGFAQVTVIDGCCESATIALAIVVDNSNSFNLTFSAKNGTRLSFAKKLAEDLVTKSINTAKDIVRISSFNGGANLLEEFSTDNDAITLVNAIRAIPSSDQPTSIFAGMNDAITALIDAEDVDYRVMVIITDGHETETQDQENLRSLAAEASRLKSIGGVIIPVGLRPGAAEFAVLSSIATKGFLISATEDNEDDVSDWLVGLMGYVCAGNCIPIGDVDLVGHGELNYSSFTNWDVIGKVDLIGGDPDHPEFDVFNLLPGNGLYVDLRGTPGDGGLRLKGSRTWQQNHTYTFTIRMAGTQRHPGQTDSVVLKIGDTVIGTIGPVDYDADFADFVVAWVPASDVDAFFSILQVPDATAWYDCGALIDEITITDTPLVGDPVEIISDNFDTENSGIIPPECLDGPIILALSPGGYSPTAGLSGYAYRCYSYGCLPEPIPAQTPDEDPPADNE